MRGRWWRRCWLSGRRWRWPQGKTHDHCRHLGCILPKSASNDRANRVAPYLVCGEETLKRFAKYRPSTLAKLGEIDGVGEQRFEQYGEVFFDAVDSFCKRRGR